MGIITSPEDALVSAMMSKQGQVRLQHCVGSLDTVFKNALKKEPRLLAYLASYQYSYIKKGLVQIMYDYDVNHENFDKLYSYPVEKWCGGKVHKIRHNVIHLMRGEVFHIEGHSIFVMGGGYSIDKYRRIEGISWWPQEMPSNEEYQAAISNLERINNCVDYILTHTAPSETVYYLSTLRNLGIKNDVTEELQLTSFLDEIYRNTTYQHWYFGHFHIDMELWRNQTAVLSSVRELTTSRIIRQWITYEE